MFQRGKYIAFYLGDPKIKCHVDAVHSKGPQADINTRNLVEHIIQNTGCSGIYALISRKDMDLNRPLNDSNTPAIMKFREAIHSILKHLKILNENEKLMEPYLQFALHGMKNYPDKEIEIGTRNNQTCSQDIFLWFKGQLEYCCEDIFKRKLKIKYNQQFIGDDSKAVHRQKYGNFFNTIQIEINKTLRTKNFDNIVEVLSKIIKNFNKTV